MLTGLCVPTDTDTFLGQIKKMFVYLDTLLYKNVSRLIQNGRQKTEF